MPSMLGGDLFERLISGKKYTEEEIRILIRNIALAVSYMHERGLVHRGMYPSPKNGRMQELTRGTNGCRFET